MFTATLCIIPHSEPLSSMSQLIQKSLKVLFQLLFFPAKAAMLLHSGLADGQCQWLTNHLAVKWVWRHCVVSSTGSVQSAALPICVLSTAADHKLKKSQPCVGIFSRPLTATLQVTFGNQNPLWSSFHSSLDHGPWLCNSLEHFY